MFDLYSHTRRERGQLSTKHGQWFCVDDNTQKMDSQSIGKNKIGQVIVPDYENGERAEADS